MICLFILMMPILIIILLKELKPNKKSIEIIKILGEYIIATGTIMFLIVNVIMLGDFKNDNINLVKEEMKEITIDINTIEKGNKDLMSV